MQRIFNEWKISEDEFEISQNYKNESIFTVANGNIGLRGDFEEGLGENSRNLGFKGNYINGFYETEVIKYGEHAYGYAKQSQTMLNVCSAKCIRLFLEDEEFLLTKGQTLEYLRELDMRDGILIRNVRWRSEKGREVIINIIRLASFNAVDTAIIGYSVESVNFEGTLTLETVLDGDVTNRTRGDDPRVGSGLKGKVLSTEDILIDTNQDGVKYSAILQSTKNTKLSYSCAAANDIASDFSYETEDTVLENQVLNKYRFKVSPGSKIKLNRYISYHTSFDNPKEMLLSKAISSVVSIYEKGTELIKAEQKEYLNTLWKYADIEIKGSTELQQSIRFNIFQLLQSTGQNGRTSIAAKGLTGEGYEGHYFWESETYIMPVFMCSLPKIARKILEYRYNILDKAREQARLLGHKKGALYSWRSINGEECSAYYPAGSAQYHLSADIAFAVKRYFEATDDIEFMLNYGAEIVFQTARLWVDSGHFNMRKGGKFCIDCVTGPDEYTAIVNNNCYTNIMARENLLYACKLAEFVRDNHKDEYLRIINKISLADDELVQFKEAGENMYIPYDENLSIHAQDDSFLDKKLLHIESIPKENLPLLCHYHPLFIYRHQICKQADLVLAEFLVSNRFSIEQKRRDYDYYEKITTHDSSLSASVFSIMASEVGYRDKAFEFFIKTARADLDDIHNNTKDGLHMANMAGTWCCIVNGFGGMRINNGEMMFRPYLPAGWESYRFRIAFKNRLLEVEVNGKNVSYRLMEGNEMNICHYGEKVRLLFNKPMLRLMPAGEV